jgi:AcrR family transcriptional regulator
LRVRLIVSAAREILENDGLDGLTIRTVLARTGLARRAFYEHFASKDELVLAVLTEALRGVVALFDEMSRPDASPLDGLKWINDTLILTTAVFNPDAAGRANRLGTAIGREHLRLAESHPAELQAAISPLIELISRLMAEGMAAGVVRPGEPQRFAVLYYNVVSTTAQMQLMAEESATPDRDKRHRLAREVWDFCLHAIEAR